MHTCLPLSHTLGLLHCVTAVLKCQSLYAFLRLKTFKRCLQFTVEDLKEDQLFLSGLC